MIHFFFSILMSMAFFTIFADEKPWKDRHAEGWAWYHDYKKLKELEKGNQKQDPITILSTSKEELERALATAILEPSKENVLTYMSLQKKWIDQSMLFSSYWQKAILEHPELASLMPTTQYGVQVQKENNRKTKQKFIQDIAKKTTLLFLYEGDCPFSQAFSKVVKDFATQYDWSVKAISADNFILRDFPQSIADASVSKEMAVKFMPALFAVDTATLEAVPLAYGMATIGQIEENIALEFDEKSR